MKRCVNCLMTHDGPGCPDLPPRAPSDAMDTLDAVVARMHGKDVWAGQLHRLCREAGIIIPLEIAMLDPDYHQEHP